MNNGRIDFSTSESGRQFTSNRLQLPALNAFHFKALVCPFNSDPDHIRRVGDHEIVQFNTIKALDAVLIKRKLLSPRMGGVWSDLVIVDICEQLTAFAHDSDFGQGGSRFG